MWTWTKTSNLNKNRKIYFYWKTNIKESDCPTQVSLCLTSGSQHFLPQAPFSIYVPLSFSPLPWHFESVCFLNIMHIIIIVIMISKISLEMTWTWLRKGSLKRKTESLLIVYVIVLCCYVKTRIDKTQQNSRCRLRGDRWKDQLHKRVQ